MNRDLRLIAPRFPRASRYHPEWVLAGVSGGANPLWLTEWLAESLDLRPGMRVLDLGCGRALSSVFLRREFGVEVWATDLWFNPGENLERLRDAGVDEGVFPLRVDARALPFAAGFFDVVMSIDAFVYFGTDDLYMNYLAAFLKPEGQVAIAGAGSMQEIEDPIPSHLAAWWAADRPYCLHSAAWWRRHWKRTGLVTVEVADSLADGWSYWLDWLKFVSPQNVVEIDCLEADRGKSLGYVRAVGRRVADAPLLETNVSVAAQYEQKPLLRE
jgi:SAM-dependent methyltransferase